MAPSLGGTREVPGEDTEGEHRELRRAYRRTRRANQAILLTTCLALALAGTVVPGLFKFLFGLIAGAALALVVFLRHRMPAGVERWAEGGDGERRTAKVLRPLADAGWVVRHDRQTDDGTVEHLLIGPTGVYLLDTKDWSGEICVSEAGFPRSQHADTGDEWEQYTLPGRMHAAAAATSQSLTALVGQAIWVRAVVVFWGRFDQAVVSTDKVTYVHGDVLVAWLGSQPETMSPATRHALLTKVQLREHASGEPPPLGSPLTMEFDA